MNSFQVNDPQARGQIESFLSSLHMIQNSMERMLVQAGRANPLPRPGIEITIPHEAFNTILIFIKIHTPDVATFDALHAASLDGELQYYGVKLKRAKREAKHDTPWSGPIGFRSNPDADLSSKE